MIPGALTTTNGGTTKLTVTGGGSLAVTNSSASVLVGVAQTVQLNTATTNVLDLTGLASVSFGTVAAPINVVRVAYGQTDSGTLLLSNSANTMTASTLDVGNSNNSNPGTGVLTLGTGSNVINTDTINIGFSKAAGTVAFASPAAGAGSVTIFNRAGVGGAALNIGSNLGTNTGATPLGTLDLRGHLAAVTAGAVTVGNNNDSGGAGFANGIINFDTGAFTASSIALGLKSSTGTGSNILNAINLSGGALTVSGATTIAAHTGTGAGTSGVTATLNVSAGTYTTGSLTGAVKNSATNTGAAVSNINVGGTGALVIQSGPFTLATEVTTGVGTAAGTLAISGGSVSSNADILNGGGAATTTIALTGGLLDEMGHNIGSGTAPINTLTFTGGTLRNVGNIFQPITQNGATSLYDVATSDSTVNGAYTVSAGTVRTAANRLLTITGAFNLNGPTATLAGSGTVNTGATKVNVTGGNLSPGVGGFGTLTIASAGVSFISSAANPGAAGNGGTLIVKTGAANATAGQPGTSDLLSLTGAGGNLDLTPTDDLLDVRPTSTGTYVVAAYGGVRTGIFDNVTENGIAEPGTFNVGTGLFTANSGDLTVLYDDPNKQVVVNIANVVPEPASIGLLGAAAVGLLARRRRRR